MQLHGLYTFNALSLEFPINTSTNNGTPYDLPHDMSDDDLLWHMKKLYKDDDENLAEKWIVTSLTRTPHMAIFEWKSSIGHISSTLLVWR